MHLYPGQTSAKTLSGSSDIAGINAQARDISFLIGYAQTLPNTDISAIAVAGFSWGGVSNLFAAAHDSRIDALVAFDGSLRYAPGLIKEAGNIHPDQMTIPLLYFTQGEISIEDIELYHSAPGSSGPSPLNAWTHGDLITVHDLALMHTEHSSMFQRNERTWKNYADVQKADYTRDDGIVGYAWMCRYTLHFLDAYLKHDAVGQAFLKKTPAENGVPQHLIAVSFRAAKGIPFSLEGFRGELGRRGFEHASEIYTDMKKEKPDFKLDEGAINDWSDMLMQEGHLSEAIALLKLNTQNYPNSSDAYTTLGEAFAKSGDKQLSRDNYEKALEKDPNNSDAKDKLKELHARSVPSK
jgi:tetratricopeptide (TPR) repeat protein